MLTPVLAKAAAAAATAKRSDFEYDAEGNEIEKRGSFEYDADGNE